MLVELPEIVTDVKLRYDRSISAIFPEKYNPCLPRPDLLGFTGEEWRVLYSAPYGTILLGLLGLLTEGQFAEFAIKMTWGGDGGIYADHTNPITSVKTSAKESVYSMLKSENVYTENPLGERPTKYKGKDLPKQVIKEMYSFAIQKWQEAQSRTIDPKRTVVLLRKERE